MTTPNPQPSVDELLDHAFQALNEGDRSRANMLASEVLRFDERNTEAEDLLAAPDDHGEIRRLTIMFADVVDSTVLSTWVEPEVYRTLVGRYRQIVQETVEQFEGHIYSTKGDGLLAVFGHPIAHENDVQRAVQAGLEINHAVANLNDRARRRFGVGVQARVGVHRGLVYLDTAEDDVYGLAANLVARLSGLAEPGTLVVSDAIERIIRDTFEVERLGARPVKGISGDVEHFRVLGEREAPVVSSGPFVGRRSEFADLTAAWNGVQNASGSAVFAIRGEAGIGKTRLATAVVENARHAGATVVEMTGSPFHSDVGLRPVRRLIERRSGITRTLYPAERLRLLQSELTSVGLDPREFVPLLAPVLGIGPQSGYRPVPVDGRKLFEQIVGAVDRYLSALIHNRPTLLLFEDLHWIDEDTFEVLEKVITRADPGLMVLMTGRDESTIPGGPATTVVDLKPLTEDEADALIDALHPDMPQDNRHAVRRRCDGVPLYIEEVVAKLKEVPGDSSELSALVPDTLYEALFARLRSTRNAVRVVEAAATIGTVIDRPLLMSVVDLPEHEVDTILTDLTEGRVLRRLDDETWRFRHELLREVAAELSTPSLRRKLNGRIGDALVAAAPPTGSPDWRLVASRYENASRHAESAHAYQQAAADARHRGALGESRNYLTHAINQIDHAALGPDRDKQETQLRLERGFLAYAAEGASSPNAAGDFERCLELSGTDLRSDELFATLTALYGYYAMRADLPRVATLLESVRANLTGREFFIPFNNAGFGMLAWYRGEFDTARTQLEGAAAARSEEGLEALEAVWFMPNEGTASIYTHLALARYIQGDLAGAEAEVRRTAERCDALDFPQGPFSLAYALQMEVLIRIDAGQFDLAASAAARLASIGEQHGFDSWALAGAVQHGFVTALQNDQVDQIATLTGYVEMWRALGVVCLITSYDGFLARLLTAAGEPERARERIDAALELAAATEMRYHDAELLRIRSHTFPPEGRADDLRSAHGLARAQAALVYELRCAVELLEIDPAARELVADAVARFPEDSGWPELARAQALLR